MLSCPICYETFSSKVENLTPHQLPCGDIICKGCIDNDIFEDSYFCPECGMECKGKSANDMGTPITIEDDRKGVEEDYFVGRETETSVNSSATSRDSLFSQFTQRTSRNSSSAPLPITSPEKKPKGLGERYGVCRIKDCKNKACGSDGHCFNHSSNKKSHLVRESKLANIMARTSLDFVQINCNENSFKFQPRKDDWPNVGPKSLIERFKRQERMELGEAMALIDRARDVLRREPNVLKLEAPVIAVGDVHGQFYDLLNMFDVGGDPMTSSSRYLFLGDYVDRGSFSCEVILSLLAYKVACPHNIWLIRGNHECASVSGHFGFKEECKMKYGVQLYYRFLLLFQTMPLAAVVTTAYGDMFACHGGLSPDILTIEDLDKIDRFVEPEENSALLDILWSDPISEERVDEMTDKEYEEFINLEWRPNPARGCSYCYGYKAVYNFLIKNSIVCLVRAHEVQENGFRKHFDPAMIESRIQQSAKYKRKMSNAVAALRRMNSSEEIKQYQGGNNVDEWNYPSHDIPTVITVFSAPNYCDRYDNQGAILKIDMALDGFQFLQYTCVPHPAPDIIESQMTHQIMSVIQTCPYMPTSFKDFVRVAIELGDEESLIEEGNENDDEFDDSDEKIAKEVEERSILGNVSLYPSSSPPTTIESKSPSKDSVKKLFGAVEDDCNISHCESEITTVDNISSSSTPDRQSGSIQRNRSINSPPTSSRKSNSVTTTVSARSDNSPPRRNPQNDNREGFVASVVKRHNSLKPQHYRRATECIHGGVHSSYTSPYLKAHASDAINELHPVRVKKYMDNFVPPEKASMQSYKESEGNDKDDEEVFQQRISYLTEQFDKQSIINTNKFIIEDRKRNSLDSLTSRPRRSASLTFVPRSSDSLLDSPSRRNWNSRGDLPRKSSTLEVDDDEEALFREARFTKKEILALRLLFSFFDRSGTSKIAYEDLVAYGEETGGLAGIRDAADALAIVDIDGDGVIGLLDFIHFAARLRDADLLKE